MPNAQVPSSFALPSPQQIPDKSLYDANGRQAYMGNAWGLSNTGIALATLTETPIQLITNPAPVAGSFQGYQPGTGPKSMFIYVRRVSSSVTGVLFKYYLNPTITTNGTAANPRNLRPGMSAKTSVSTCFTAPTISANGNLVASLSAPATYQPSIDETMIIILDPGMSLLINALALSATATVINSDFMWWEL